MRPLRDAIARLAARPRLLGAVVAVHVAVALLGGAHLGATLAPLTDGRPAATRMLAGDDGLFGELIMDHPEILRVGAASAETSALLYGLLAWILAGGLLAALVTDEEHAARGAPEVLAACARHASRMVRVGAAGLSLRLIPVAAGTGAWFALHPWWRTRGFRELAISLALVGLLGGAAWSFVSVTVDYARGLVFRDPALGAWRALARGLRLALRRRGDTARLVAFSGLGFVAVTALYLLIALRVPSGAAWAPLALALLRLAAAAGRAFVTIAALTAAARVAVK